MGYRGDLIRRLQHDGLWAQLTGDQQGRFETLTDDQARQIMVMDDQWDMGDRKAIELFGLMSLVQVIISFQGALVEHGGENVGKLSKAGRLLAEFLTELRQKGLSAEDIDAGLQKLSPLVIAALTTVYKGSPE
ncbi:MAG: hypothetical protein ACYTG0_03050 [Planctomycetota bacterium]|jgi:hypothetical protein